MVLALVILFAASFLASGILFNHKRILTYLSVAGVMAEGMWLLLTVIDRVVLEEVSSFAVYTGGSLLLLLVWILLRRHWKKPPRLAGKTIVKELVIIVVIAAVLLAAWMVAERNGFDKEGRWVMHGFYNGDTTTLIALVQRSFSYKGLVDTNPFSGGEDLEYPTLLHGGLASLLEGLSLRGEWLNYLPLMTYIQILLTVPMFFLLWDVVFAEPGDKFRLWFGLPKRRWILLGQAAIVCYVMAVSWDSYIYPQSHFFLTAIYLLVIALLLETNNKELPRQCLWLTCAGLLAFALMMANAVTGAAVVAITSVFYLLKAADGKQEWWQRAWFIVGIIGWGIVYFKLAPGEASFGRPSFSYTSAESLMRMFPIVLALAVGVWLYIDRHEFMGGAVVALMAMAVFTFFFSNREIIVANAERFIYHGLLVGYPLLLAPLIQLWYWLRRLLIYTTLSWARRIIVWGGALSLLFLVLLPALISGARAHDHLMYRHESVIGKDEIAAIGAIEQRAGKDSIIIASPNSPWAVPLFTGYNILRSDYWLSKDDKTQQELKRAWSGDRSAQQIILQEGDYLVLTVDEQDKWDTGNYEQIYSNSAVSAYKL